MNVDLSDCKFLDIRYTFYTYNEFVEKRNVFKRNYNKLSSIQKEFYHYYIYANTHMTLPYKDRIWDFLNDDCSEEDLLKIEKFYKPR